MRLRSVSGAVLVVVASLVFAGASSAGTPPFPMNTAPPVLAPDHPLIGQTVTVTPGTWSNEDATSTVSYQWYRAINQQLYPITGATGTSYTVTTADESGLTVLVTVTTGSGVVSTAVYSNPISITLPSTPTNVTAPVITGQPLRGSTLHVSTGTWSQYPSQIAGSLTISYQWIRCNLTACSTPIPGATKPSYRIQPSDWGYGLTVKVTATDLIGSTYAYSNSVGVMPPSEYSYTWPFSQFIAGDPLLNAPAPGGSCLGDPAGCLEQSVATIVRNGGFTQVLTVRKRGKLAVSWVATRAGKKVTIGSERASFRRRGKYRTRFVLTTSGRSLLGSAHTLHFLVDSWVSFPPTVPDRCAYPATLEAGGQIAIDPRYCDPANDKDPF